MATSDFPQGIFDPTLYLIPEQSYGTLWENL